MLQMVREKSQNFRAELQFHPSVGGEEFEKETFAELNHEIQKIKRENVHLRQQIRKLEHAPVHSAPAPLKSYSAKLCAKVIDASLYWNYKACKSFLHLPSFMFSDFSMTSPGNLVSQAMWSYSRCHSVCRLQCFTISGHSDQISIFLPEESYPFAHDLWSNCSRYFGAVVQFLGYSIL